MKPLPTRKLREHTRKYLAIPLLLATTTLFAVVGIASCKQGEGERCQVDSDCENGLTCNQATQQCATGGQMGGIDATVPDGTDAPDAPFDAPDDAIDAPRD